MQASFTPQEHQVIDQLKSKYTGLKEAHGAPEEGDTCLRCEAGDSDTSSTPRPAGLTTQASNVDASVCSFCNGSGTLIEIYNHRRLEKYCQHCDGRGVHVYKNGVEIKESVAASVGLSSGTARGASGVVALHSRKAVSGTGNGDSSSSTEAVSERATALERDLQKIVGKAAAYTKERLDVLVVLQRSGSSSIPEGREQAARDLVTQLDLQLERLELMRCKKQAELGQLGA